MLPREIFEILHAVMAISVLFQHFSGKLCLNFLTLNLSTSPIAYGAFCSHILNCACLRRKAYRNRRGLKLCKICIYQKQLKKAGEVNAHPSSHQPP